MWCVQGGWGEGSCGCSSASWRPAPSICGGAERRVCSNLTESGPARLGSPVRPRPDLLSCGQLAGLVCASRGEAGQGRAPPHKRQGTHTHTHTHTHTLLPFHSSSFSLSLTTSPFISSFLSASVVCLTVQLPTNFKIKLLKRSVCGLTAGL